MNAMLDMLKPALERGGALAPAPPRPAYAGPDRRRESTHAARWLTLMLEEVGHGMLLLSDDAHVLHANHRARIELDPAHPLRLHGRQLCARDSRDEHQLSEALRAAARGLRRMLVVGTGERRTSVAVVPLDPIDGQVLTLVSLGKRHLSEQLTLQCFARSHGLTAAEMRVLEALCAGVDPNGIAARYAVAIATVRTQVSSIRHKTGTADITALMRLVAQLPPMVPALRGAFGGVDGSNDAMRLSA